MNTSDFAEGSLEFRFLINKRARLLLVYRSSRLIREHRWWLVVAHGKDCATQQRTFERKSDSALPLSRRSSSSLDISSKSANYFTNLHENRSKGYVSFFLSFFLPMHSRSILIPFDVYIGPCNFLPRQFYISSTIASSLNLWIWKKMSWITLEDRENYLEYHF